MVLLYERLLNVIFLSGNLDRFSHALLSYHAQHAMMTAVHDEYHIGIVALQTSEAKVFVWPFMTLLFICGDNRHQLHHISLCH